MIRSLALAILLTLSTGSPAQSLCIYQINVEQAVAALVVMPNGKTLLLDSGKNAHGSNVRATSVRNVER